jgi:hypothetical protein
MSIFDLMLLKSTRPLLLVLMAAILAVQGVFAGVAICREDTGQSNLEWTNNGQCDQPGTRQVVCAHEVAASESHCGPCIDVTIPSDKALKSVSLSFAIPFALVASVFEFSFPPSPRAFTASLAVSYSPASEHLRSVRLLI